MHMVYSGFFTMKEIRQTGPTPLASCEQCFLRNQGYCREVEMREETVREVERDEGVRTM